MRLMGFAKAWQVFFIGINAASRFKYNTFFVIRLNIYLLLNLVFRHVCVKASPVGGGNAPPSCRPLKKEEETRNC